MVAVNSGPMRIATRFGGSGPCRSDRDLQREFARFARLYVSRTMESNPAEDAVAPRFKNYDTELVFQGKHVRAFSGFADRAERRLVQLVAATSLADLGLPGLRLEALRGDRAGQYSVRINRQYRVCFEWIDGGARNIEIVDYH